ncbi:MAG: hypothetical protein ACF8R7_17820 [Phycisphaerales bacterium JB039]
MQLDRDALRQKLEDARYRVEGVFGGMDPERRKLAIRLGIMGSLLVVLLLVGVTFAWRGAGGGGRFERAVAASDQTQSLAETVRGRLAGRPEFAEISVNAVAIGGDSADRLMVYGGVPSTEAMEELRATIESAAPGTAVDWRVGVVRPGDRLEPEGG